MLYWLSFSPTSSTFFYDVLIHLFLSKWSLSYPCNSCFPFLHYVYGRLYLFASLWFLLPSFTFLSSPWSSVITVTTVPPFPSLPSTIFCLIISSSFYILSWFSLSFKAKLGPSFHRPIFFTSPFKPVLVVSFFFFLSLFYTFSILVFFWVNIYSVY